MLGRCHTCKGKEHKIFDEEIGESKDTKDADRFAEIEKIEAMSPAEKFAFFQKELSKCIRCNACRNVCPACSCRKCVFDSDKFDSAQKANVDSFEEKMFHIIRAFHVAGRCTDSVSYTHLGVLMSSKITIIGAGSVGSTIAYNLSNNDLASEIVLIDINKEKVEGEVMDIVQGTSFRNPISIVAGDYEAVSYTHLDVYKRQGQGCGFFSKNV